MAARSCTAVHYRRPYNVQETMKAICAPRRMNRIHRLVFCLFGVSFLLVLWMWHAYLPGDKIRCNSPDCWKQYEAIMANTKEEKKTFRSPLANIRGVVLGGVERSGINLLRTVLNAHPMLDCTHEISLTKWKEYDMTDHEVLLDIAKAIKEELPDDNICVRADFDYIDIISKILPNAKFIVVVRDGRAVAHSLTSHTGMYPDFDSALNEWSKSLTMMLDNCYGLGNEVCMIMIYEKLVVDTEVWIKAALNFAGLPWNSDVLNHSSITEDDYYNK